MIEIDAETLPATSAPSASRSAAPAARVPSQPTAKSLSAAERDHILAALQRSNWVIDGPAGAARVLDMHPNTLRSRLKKLGITRPPAHEPS